VDERPTRSTVPDGSEAPGMRAARLTGGWILVALGLWLLIAQYVHLEWNLVWPFVVMGAGVLLIVVALRRRGG
jgi:hypothetical protein